MPLLAVLLQVGASGFLRRSISVAFGPAESLAFAAVTVTQFHLPFYWSRSLPNTIALVFTTTAAGFWVRGYRCAPPGTPNQHASLGVLLELVC